MGERAECIKMCLPTILVHESIFVGDILELELLSNLFMVVRIDPCGFKEIICQLDSEFFGEHFVIV